MDIVSFCGKLNPEDWSKPATKKWRVKDVVSHLVGWEREVAQEFKRTWGSKNEPWFMKVENYDDFNEKIFNEFKDCSPTELLAELKKWQGVVSKEIADAGETNIRQHPHMDWLFDEGGEPHFEHHLKQIQLALGLSNSGC